MDGVNIYQGQIQGPFKANQDVFSLISAQCISKPRYISHLGIQTETDSILLHGLPFVNGGFRAYPSAEAGCPGNLKIEATGIAIQVQQLPGKV